MNNLYQPSTSSNLYVDHGTKDVNKKKITNPETEEAAKLLLDYDEQKETVDLLEIHQQIKKNGKHYKHRQQIILE